MVGYWGDYRAAKGTVPAGETTSTVEVTGTAQAKVATESGSGLNVMTPSDDKAAQWVVVQIEGLNLRTQPESDAEVIRGLKRNEKLRYVSGKPGWYQVTDTEGRTGWISSNSQYATLED